MKPLQEYMTDMLRSTHMYEMAKSQDKCEECVRGQCDNILENITLINYFRISELYTTNIGHWKDELTGAIYNASKFNLKGNNDITRRLRLVDRVFREEDMCVYDNVVYRVELKFKREEETQYKTHKDAVEWLDKAVLRTISQIDTIKRLIAEKNTQKISHFVGQL